MIGSFLFVFIPAMLVELCRIKFLPFSKLLKLYKSDDCGHSHNCGQQEVEQKSELENEVEEVKKELQALINEGE